MQLKTEQVFELQTAIIDKLSVFEKGAIKTKHESPGNLRSSCRAMVT